MKVRTCRSDPLARIIHESVTPLEFRKSIHLSLLLTIKIPFY
jgi:hypothetical protein